MQLGACQKQGSVMIMQTEGFSLPLQSNAGRETLGFEGTSPGYLVPRAEASKSVLVVATWT